MYGAEHIPCLPKVVNVTMRKAEELEDFTVKHDDINHDINNELIIPMGSMSIKTPDEHHNERVP